MSRKWCLTFNTQRADDKDGLIKREMIDFINVEFIIALNTVGVFYWAGHASFGAKECLVAKDIKRITLTDSPAEVGNRIQRVHCHKVIELEYVPREELIGGRTAKPHISYRVLYQLIGDAWKQRLKKLVGSAAFKSSATPEQYTAADCASQRGTTSGIYIHLDRARDDARAYEEYSRKTERSNQDQ